MKEFHPDLERGDAFLHNSPYHGCSHPADHTILVPVIDDEGSHRFTVVAKAHQADCGKFHRHHLSRLGARRVRGRRADIPGGTGCSAATRQSTTSSACAGCASACRTSGGATSLPCWAPRRVGERELLALAEETGWETLDRFSAEWFDYSERRMVDALEGTARRQPHRRQAPTIPIPGAPEGVTVKVAVRVDPGRFADRGRPPG